LRTYIIKMPSGFWDMHKNAGHTLWGLEE